MKCTSCQRILAYAKPHFSHMWPSLGPIIYHDMCEMWHKWYVERAGTLYCGGLFRAVLPLHKMD